MDRATAQRDWIIAPPHPHRERLASQAGVAPLVAQLLLNRGVDTAGQVRQFLTPDLRQLQPPESLPNAVAAARRLIDAARTGRRIVIYGDYDVDGVTATTILWHALQLARANASFYIPHRLDEGYGLNDDALARIADDGSALVITVDCGITAVAEARRARDLGLDLIITDHHEPRGELPEVACLVHPTACGVSANPHLSGAGVALKIAWALARELSGGERVAAPFRDFLLEATTLAALGSVADVVPLTGENRIIASFGLKQLAHTTNTGLKALIEVSRLSAKKTYDDYDVGFALAPRLNAIGRLGQAQLAVELFTRADPERARELAVSLDAHNRKRQQIERHILEQAETLVIQRGFDRDSCHGIVLASSAWHAGVIGIVAARLVERFHRPTILIAMENGIGQGSGRSVRHFPLHEVLHACAPHLLSHGGHAMAGGIRIRADQVEPFTAAFLAEANRRLTASDLQPKLYLDDEVDIGQLTTEVVESLQRLAPHGPGNAAPRLASPALNLVEPPRAVGKDGNHLQFRVAQGGQFRKAIAFGFGPRAAELRQQQRVRLAFEPILNQWHDRRNVELKVVDWKPGHAQRE